MPDSSGDSNRTYSSGFRTDPGDFMRAEPVSYFASRAVPVASPIDGR